MVYARGMRSVLLILTLALAGCASQPVAEQVKDEPLQEYTLRGEIISLDNQAHIAKIKHEQIGDWMGPMTMEFPVKDEAEFGKLKQGTYVEGKLHVRGLDFWADSFREVPAPPPAAETPAETK